jgi:phosphoenolpyruvate-protein phosphotransferase (PTS system enzyme I)
MKPPETTDESRRAVPPGPRVISGIGAAPGVAIGPCYLFERGRVRTPRYHLAPKDTEPEVRRLQIALLRSDDQLAETQARVEERSRSREGVAGALGGEREYVLILDAHRAMVGDRSFVDEISRVIREERLNAEWAVRRTIRNLKGTLSQVGDEYFRERRADLDFLGDRLVRNLLGHKVDLPVAPPDGCILVCRDLSPADAAMLLLGGKVAGLVTDQGGRTGHTALVARARNIPAVVGAENASAQCKEGELLAVDGSRGVVIIAPAGSELEQMEKGRDRFQVQEVQFLAESELPSQTKDGVNIELLANIEFSEEASSAFAHGAAGVGLYRTEFLYLHRRELPSEEDHLASYRTILEAAGKRPVTIRTFDLGMDKVPSGGSRHREANPAMGLRGIRYMLKFPAMFRTQLRALLRASTAGNLRIMFPMVSGLTELREARAQLEAVRAELARAGEPMADRVPIGIMIELPAAASIADRLARECDFFSIGTNDLIQYSLAIDRQNPDVSYLYRPLHLGVLRSIEFIVRSGHAAGIPVAMCGEMAGDPFYTAILVAIGLNELSMSTTAIPAVKRIIRAMATEEAKQLLAEAMAYSSGEEIERYVRVKMSERFGDLLA